MTRTATGAVLAACLAATSVLGLGYGSVTIADHDDAVVDAPASPAEIERAAGLHHALGDAARRHAWEAERRAEAEAARAAAEAEAARVAAQRTPVQAAAANEARPVVLDGFLGTFEITCYSLRGTTASGRPVGDDVVAVDPDVIPLGSHIVIDGIGERVAADTGGSIKGNRLDIWMSSRDDCIQFGRQHRKVWWAG